MEPLIVDRGATVSLVELAMYPGWLKLELSDAAAAASRGETVASWPDGELASETTWNAMFARYSLRYEELQLPDRRSGAATRSSYERSSPRTSWTVPSFTSSAK